jgi:phage terminase large subunit GpA-like protein
MPCKAPRHVAFRIWTAYSPQREWRDIVREFLESRVKLKQGDDGPMQGFINETLGETWELRGESADEHELSKRTHTYQLRTVPEGCLVLGAGIDVQDNRFEISVWGFGRGEQMWLIDDQVLEANPADERDWQKLDDYLQTRFPQVGRETTLGIQSSGIDTGGHFTHNVYNFARLRERQRVAALRGSPYDGRPIKGKASRVDVNWRGQVLKRGIKLWEVGTDTAKDLFFGRLLVNRPGPGYVNFPAGLDDDYYAQLTAEHRVMQRTATGDKFRWVKKRAGQRNEKLDCAVYALFVAHLLDLHRYTETMWDRLEAAVQPQPDLFDQRHREPVAISPELASTPRNPQRQGAREW